MLKTLAQMYSTPRVGKKFGHVMAGLKIFKPRAEFCLLFLEEQEEVVGKPNARARFPIID